MQFKSQHDTQSNKQIRQGLQSAQNNFIQCGTCKTHFPLLVKMKMYIFRLLSEKTLKTLKNCETEKLMEHKKNQK